MPANQEQLKAHLMMMKPGRKQLPKLYEPIYPAAVAYQNKTEKLKHDLQAQHEKRVAQNERAVRGIHVGDFFGKEINSQ